MRGEVADKVRAPLAGVPLWLHSLQAFERSGIARSAVIVYRDAEQKQAFAEDLATHPTSLTLHWTTGGAERQDSVLNGLHALPPEVRYVYIHDCARPLIQPESLQALHEAVQQDRAAVLAHRVADTIKEAPGSKENLTARQLRDIPRADLWAMQTPQAFERELIAQAYKQVRAEGAKITDDTAAASHAGHPVTLVENPWPNPKLTTPADLGLLAYLREHRKSKPGPAT